MLVNTPLGQNSEQAAQENDSTQIYNTDGKGISGLIGQVLGGRYEVKKEIAGGRESQVFSGFDLTKDFDNQPPFVIKVSTEYTEMGREIKIIRKLWH